MIYSSNVMTLDERRFAIGVGSAIDPKSVIIDLVMEYSDNIANLYVEFEKQIISSSSNDLVINTKDLTLQYGVIQHNDLVNTFLQISNQLAIVFLLMGAFDIGTEPTIEFRRQTVNNIVRALNNTSTLQATTSIKENKSQGRGTF